MALFFPPKGFPATLAFRPLPCVASPRRLFPAQGSGPSVPDSVSPPCWSREEPPDAAQRPRTRVPSRGDWPRRWACDRQGQGGLSQDCPAEDRRRACSFSHSPSTLPGLQGSGHGLGEADPDCPPPTGVPASHDLSGLGSQCSPSEGSADLPGFPSHLGG